MNGSFWRPSGEERRTILLLEALALVHDIGKLSDKFLESQAPGSTVSYKHNLMVDPHRVSIYSNCQAAPGNKAAKHVREWLNDAMSKPAPFRERPDLTDLLLRVQFRDWTGQVYTLADLMPMLPHPGLRTIPASDWRAVLGKEMLPGMLVGYLHGLAHFEKEGTPPRNKQPYTDVFRATAFGLEEPVLTGPCRELTTALNNLPLRDIEDVTTCGRRRWLTAMKEHMTRGLADTRRPHNDVSLWDWGYATATLTKAAATWIFRFGWPSDLGMLPYRTLRVSLRRLERYMHCDKIGDLMGVSQVLDSAFESVRTLLEETYALGNCFYHDETGAYYLLADLAHTDAEADALRQEIQRQFPPDLRPLVRLSNPIAAGQLDHDPGLVRCLVAEPRERALREPRVCSTNNLYLFEAEWREARPENGEICTACNSYPVGYPCCGSSVDVEQELARWATQDKAERRNVCRVCLDRRGRRAEDWARRDLRGTVWMDEVADDNGRVALLVGKLGLEGWLDGSLLASIYVGDGAPSIQTTQKTPSPARLFRIVETCRLFWERVTDELTPAIVGIRGFRLALYPTPYNLTGLGDFHAYELSMGGMALSVLWDRPNRRFLTTENLGYFAQRWRVPEDALAGGLQGQTLDVVEPPGFPGTARVLATVQVDRVEALSGYLPAIPLLTEPSVLMTLVPGAVALNLARAVKGRYERDMGRVRDRLPLYLGLAFCRRRVPVRAALEAGRAMLSMGGLTGRESWRLQANQSHPGERELVFDHGITWRVPVLAGDCRTHDSWYPRMYVGDRWGDSRPVHLDGLQTGAVWVWPSRFDFEYLDATSRRFEIYYGTDGRRPRRTRPFYLEDMDRLDMLWNLLSPLSVSQRHQVISTIETIREEWFGQDRDDQSRTDPVFQQFVADTLAGAAWPRSKPWASVKPECREALVTAGARGELADLAELRMEILKESGGN